jgi:hypothetical protein
MNSSPVQRTPITYARGSGARQSKRLRQNKDRDEQRTFRVTKATTVKDLKMLVSILWCPSKHIPIYAFIGMPRVWDPDYLPAPLLPR